MVRPIVQDHLAKDAQIVRCGKDPSVSSDSVERPRVFIVDTESSAGVFCLVHLRSPHGLRAGRFILPQDLDLVFGRGGAVVVWH